MTGRSEPSESNRDGGSILARLAMESGVQSRIVLRDIGDDSSPPISPIPTEVGTSLIGTSRYHLVGEIARGGVGAIWRSRDQDLGRDVAMKVLLERHADKRDVIQRFIEEAQIGGQLQHPGIVPVYELGLLADKRPFFTMKLVKGRTLSALLQDRSSPQQDRQHCVAVFEKVCQTVAYAHARGVVHRDLKPSNVMVGSFGEVQIVDWGFAKVMARGGIEDERRTREQTSTISIIETIRTHGGEGSQSVAGSLLGTPAYMPPEQAMGNVDKLDERSDVFCLGGILCEILTGGPPYAGTDPEHLVLRALQADLKDAHQRLDHCGADKELIVLAKELLAPGRSNRPPHATAVAKRVSDYRASVEERVRRSEIAAVEAHAAVETARMKAAEQKRRAEDERRRRLLTMALAGTVMAFLLAGGGAYVWAKGARQERIATATSKMNEALDEALRLAGDARASGDVAMWDRALAAADRARAVAQAGETEPGVRARTERTANELAAGRAAAQLERERRELDSRTRERLAEIRSLSGDIFEDERTHAAYTRVFDQYGIPVGKLDAEAAADRVRAAEIRVELGAALDDWSWVRGRLAATTTPTASHLRAIARHGDPDIQRVQLRDLIATGDAPGLRAFAARSDLTAQAPLTLRLLANALGYGGSAMEAVAVLEAAQHRTPGDPWLNFDLAYWLTAVDPPRWAEAVRYYTAALALRPGSPGTLNNLGSALIEVGEYGRAVEVLEEVVTIAPDYARAHLNLGVAQRRVGKADGIAAIQKAVALSPNYGLAYHHLGVAYRERKELDNAIAAYKKACALDPMLAVAHYDLVEAMIAQGEVKEAVEFCRTVVATHKDQGWAHHNLGFALVHENNLPEALSCFSKAIELDPKLAAAYQDEGAALWRTGNLLGAIDAYRKAVDLKPDDATARYNLGVMYADAGRLDEAIREYKEAVRLKQDYSAALDDLAMAQSARGETLRAIESCKRAVQADPKSTVASYRLGTLLGATMKAEDGLAAYRQLTDEVDAEAGSFLRGLADAQAGRGTYDDAITCLREAFRLVPTDQSVNADLGRVLGLRGGRDDAIATYGAMATNPPAEVRKCFINGLGNGLYGRGEYEAAAACYRDAIALAENEVTLHYNLANALANIASVEEAHEEILKTLAIDPGNAAAWSMLGWTVGARSSLAEVHAFWAERCEGGMPYYQARFLNGAGRGLLWKGELAEAALACAESSKLQPDLYEPYFDVARIRLRQGRVDEAAAACAKAIRCQPGAADLQAWLGRILGRRHSSKGAAAEYRRLTKSDPGAPFSRGVSVGLRDRGLVEEARAAIPGANDAMLGVILKMEGRLDEAVAAEERARGENPLDASVRRELSWLLQCSGRDDDAITEGEAEVRLDASSASARITLGLAYLSAKRYVEAGASFQQACVLAQRRHEAGNAAFATCLARSAALGAEADAVFRGKYKPENAAEMLACGYLCGVSKHPAHAAAYFGDALAADPSLADPLLPHGYWAACAAALAGAGDGLDATSLNGQTRRKWRLEARDRLMTRVTQVEERIKVDADADRDALIEGSQLNMAWWDPDLRYVRDEVELSQLAEGERKSWQQLWERLESVVRYAQDVAKH